MNITHLERIGSTNDYIKQNADRICHLDAVYTLCQTGGRGRRGRSWEAQGGIALSFFVKQTNDPLLIPAIAALATLKVFQNCGINDLKIKWPNDILCGGKKLAGILCEGIGSGYVVGIGINNSQTSDYFEELCLPYATSVRIFANRELVAEDTVVAIVNEYKALSCLPNENIIDEYSKACINIGKDVRVISNDGETVAKAVGIAQNAGLIISRGDVTETVISGEVSVRGIYGYSE